MTPRLQALLRKAVAPYAGDVAVSRRSEAAMALAVEGAELPALVESSLDDFLEEATEDRLRALQAAVVTSRELLIGVRPVIELAVGLAVHKLLEPDEVAESLASLPYASRTELSPEEMHLVEVADAVIEDRRDQVMAVGDDDVFADAIRACWKSGSKK